MSVSIVQFEESKRFQEVLRLALAGLHTHTLTHPKYTNILEGSSAYYMTTTCLQRAASTP